MNKSLLVAVKTVIWITMLSSSLWAANGTSANASEISKTALKERIESLHSAVDLRYTDEVHSIINTYIKAHRKGAERILGLSEQYFPVYEAELLKKGLPHELKYLSIVESGLRPTATSSTGAAGLWQFMKATGKLYGLRINDVVDERRDVVRSTQAATKYLQDLHDQFGDWTLALAAYNCGPGNVRKALRHSQEEEFWDMKWRGFLPRETRRYIPKYVAISYVMNYSHAHELYPHHSTQAERLATVEIYDYTSFTKISQHTGLDKATIAKYNPSYRKWYIPKSSKGYYLTLPESALYEYLAYEGGFENLVDFGVHSQMLQGQYMIKGALKRQSIQIVEYLDKLAFDAQIIPTTLSIPQFTMSKDLDLTSAIGSKTHVLRPEESLADLATRYKISIARLIELNDINLSTPPTSGTIIRLE